MIDLIQEYEKNDILTTLDGNEKGKKVLLKIAGGIGDALIVASSVAQELAESEVSVCVRRHQVPLIGYVEGVSFVYPMEELKDPTFENQFDYSLDFTGFVADLMNLREGSYYKLAGERIGRSLKPGKLLLRMGEVAHNSVAIHAGASNPNRRWHYENWGKVALSFQEAGYHVYWLGTKEEYGFTMDGVTKLSDISDGLVFQSQMLAGCTHFLGNDSGFAHIAGLLGIRGAVAFFSTDPSDVVGEYPQITPIHVFDKVGIPSRSLNIDDPSAYRAMDAMTVGDVLKPFGISESTRTPPQKVSDVHLAYKPSSSLAKFLKYLKQDYVMIKDHEGTSGHPLLYFLDGASYVQKGDKKYRISCANPEILKRGIREVLVYD